MSMQIKSILLYNSDGAIRSLSFQLGRVNIITGRSSTGKSAIIDIIEYCLGRSTFKVPEGPIRDKVVWYAVIYQIDEIQVMIAKPAPPSGAASHSAAYLEVGVQIIPPSLSKLLVNSNDTAIIEYLTRLIGIAPNLHIPEDDQSRNSLEATIRHASFYLYQKQNIIANQEILFYRQGENSIPQAIKDTLPYFLGAVREDRLKLIQELRELRRELRLERRRLQEAEPEDTEGNARGSGLVLEAQQVGILPDTDTADGVKDPLSVLRQVVQWEPQAVVSETQTTDQIMRLQSELRDLRAQFQRKLGQIQSAETFAAEAEGYTSEANQQELRLESINLIDFSGNDIESCPICLSHISNTVTPISNINRSLQRMRANLESVQRERPKLRDYIQRLIREREDIRQRINETEANITNLVQEDSNAQRLRDTNNRIAHVLGRISFYLESVTLTDDVSPLRLRVERLEQRINTYQDQLDPTETEDILTSILSLLSVDMSNWAETLELEYAGSPYRFDLNKLTVIADRPGRPILMNQGMGGGQNWLGCHLIAHLALHKYFANQARPVPNFLILDQPTQVYFPEDRYTLMEGEINEITDEDRIAVNRMFNLLFAVCKELFPNFQIIVLDHANIDTQDFQNALVEEPWRGDRALIPVEWL